MSIDKHRWAVGLLLGLNAVTAEASLIDRGNGLIFDDVLNITWLQDANYAKTSGYDGDGRMTWDAANLWATNLVYQGYDDWRLPTITDTGAPGCNFAYGGTDCGYNVDTSTSELAYMYFENLGLKSPYNTSGGYQPVYGIFGNGTYNGTDWTSYGQNDVGLVNNLQAYVYWSGSEYALATSNEWGFSIVDGYQHGFNKTNEFYAWAVRAGDVAAPSQGNNVPEPGSLALLGLGLIALRRAQRR